MKNDDRDDDDMRVTWKAIWQSRLLDVLAVTVVTSALAGVTITCASASDQHPAMCQSPAHAAERTAEPRLPIDHLQPGADVATQGKAMRATIDILQAHVRDLRKALHLNR
jgi:hypothetical protein